MGDLTEHFSRAEFRDGETGELVEPPSVLLWHLEALRAIVDRPIYVVSFYRSPAHQRRIYTALRAQDRKAGRRPRRFVLGYHPMRLAVDVHAGVVTVDQAVAAGFTGIGRRGKWAVHLDCRPSDHPVIFTDPA